jgi:hypothetical protein
MYGWMDEWMHVYCNGSRWHYGADHVTPSIRKSWH